MQLTSSQLTTLRNWVNDNNNSVFDESAVNLLNATASPDYFIFKTELTIDEIMSNGFDWTRVDNASVGQSRIWEWLTQLGTVNPSKINVLRAIGEAWKGTTPQAQVDHRRSILAYCRRPARVWEKLFSVATADWNVGTNADQSGARGSSTNPDTPGTGADGSLLSGEINIDIVVQAGS